MRATILLAILTVIGIAAGLLMPAPQPLAPPRARSGLHNVLTVRPGLISGSLPEGDAGWRSLAAMGIRTLICVDGMPPDVEQSRRFGVRPVHVPIGYDGVPRPAALALARAVRDLPGPVYLHCHHGQHRGPAAAAAAALCLDPAYSPAEAAQLLRDAGTDPKYPGLVGVPRTLIRPRRGELDAAPADFPPRAEVPDLAARMVEIDHVYDRVKGRGATPADAAELAELLRESARLPSGRVAESGLAAELIAAANRAQRVAEPGGVLAVGRSCSACHARHRDGAGR